MTTPHDPHRDDDLSEGERAFAQALGARLSRLGGPREPSAALDAAILAAARSAVSGDAAAPAAGSSPSSPQTPPDAPAERGTVVALPPRTPKPRWPLGLSLAASLVLAAGIGIKLYDGGLSHDTAFSADAAAESADAFAQEAPEPLAEAMLIDPPLQREPPPPPPPLEEAAAQAKAQARGNRAERVTTAGASAAAVETDAAADAMGILPQEVSAPSAPPPAPLPARRPAPPEPAVAGEGGALDRVEVTGTRVGDSRNVGAAEHTRTQLSERRREATEAARAAEAQREAAKAESLRRQESAERRAVAAPPPPPPPSPPPPPPVVAPAPVAAPALAPPPASTSATPQPRAAPTAAAPPSSAARVGAGSGFAAAPPADKAPAEAEAADTLYDERPPVSADSAEFRQAWVQRIRKLLADGRRSQAAESLLEFRRRYPDAVVPEDLRPLLTPEPPPSTP